MKSIFKHGEWSTGTYVYVKYLTWSLHKRQKLLYNILGKVRLILELFNILFEFIYSKIFASMFIPQTFQSLSKLFRMTNKIQLNLIFPH